MQAIVCTEHGAPDLLQLKDVPRPELGAGQVRVRVSAVGINYIECLLVQGTYQIKVPTPFVPGGDLAGEVVEVGAGVSGITPGQRVLASTGIGALTEEVVLAPAQLTPIPAGMSDAHGATFLQSTATAWFALKHCGAIRAGDTLLVLGAAGGTGMAAVTLGRALGARVIAAASSEDKLAACRAAGANETINYSSEDLKTRAKELSGGGVDLVFDPVGGALAEPALRACAPGARYLVIGFVGGPIPQIPLNLPLLKRCSIVGVNWGASVTADPALAPDVHEDIVRLFEEGSIPPPPITEFPLADSAAAMNSLLNREIVGRAVVRVAQG